MSEWSQWLSYNVAPDYSGCAVYQFRQLKSGEVSPIPRWGGVDHEGILVIGETDNMLRRWKDSFRAIEKGSGSSTLNLLKYIIAYSGFVDHFKEDYSFDYRFKQVESKQAACSDENLLITMYVCKFWEPPPLNSEVPGRYADHIWDKCCGILFPELAAQDKVADECP